MSTNKANSGKKNRSKYAIKLSKFQGYFSHEYRKSIALDTRVFSGFLWKQGNIVKNWKLRWFILSNKYELKYYTKSDLKSLKGTINFRETKVLSIVINKEFEYDKLFGVTKNRIKTYPFIMRTMERTWIFRSQTEFDRQQFVYNIKKMLLSIQNETNMICNDDLKLDNDMLNNNSDECEGFIYSIDIDSCKNILKYNDFSSPNSYIQIIYRTENGTQLDSTIIMEGNEDPIINEKFLRVFSAKLHTIELKLWRLVKHLKHFKVNVDGNDKELTGMISIDMKTFKEYGKYVDMPFNHEYDIRNGIPELIPIFGSIKLRICADEIDSDMHTSITIKNDYKLLQILLYYLNYGIQNNFENGIELSYSFMDYISQCNFTWQMLSDKILKSQSDIQKRFIFQYAHQYFTKIPSTIDTTGMDMNKINTFMKVIRSQTNKFYNKYIENKYNKCQKQK